MLKLAKKIGPQSFTKILYLAVTFFNLWQFVISFLYLVYNAVLTAMLVANEWNEFEETRKTLRVTAPQNIQRSSYFVSVSLKYGLPIVIIFGVLHFTVSQSVFVMYLTRFLFDRTKDVSNRSVTSGYSCIAIIACEQSLRLFFTLFSSFFFSLFFLLTSAMPRFSVS